MSESDNSGVSQWVERAPRYLLTVNDEKRLRFANLEMRGESIYANLRNISETGLAFTAAAGDIPAEGEMIKVEFVIPDERQIACFAKVVRVEEKSDNDPEWGGNPYVHVALQFRNLPEIANRVIARGLRGKPKIDDQILEVGRFKLSRPILRGAAIAAILGAVAAFVWFTMGDS